MTQTIPRAGLILATFDAVIERSMVWRVDWSVGLDVPEYQDPEVARSGGHPDIPVPPGALVFLSFMPDDSWLAAAGISFERSLAVRRSFTTHEPLHVGDRVLGTTSVAEVGKRAVRTGVVVTTTIRTEYHFNERPAGDEDVVYSTKYSSGEL